MKKKKQMLPREFKEPVLTKVTRTGSIQMHRQHRVAFTTKTTKTPLSFWCLKTLRWKKALDYLKTLRAMAKDTTSKIPNFWLSSSDLRIEWYGLF